MKIELEKEELSFISGILKDVLEDVENWKLSVEEEYILKTCLCKLGFPYYQEEDM